jgi:hypothetical protein
LDAKIAPQGVTIARDFTAKLEAERGVTAHPASLSRFLIVQGFTVKKNAAGVRSRSR